MIMKTQRTEKGRFGEYGGMYVAETLMTALLELEDAYTKAIADESFRAEYMQILRDYVGRPSALYHAKRLSEYCGDLCALACSCR